MCNRIRIFATMLWRQMMFTQLRDLFQLFLRRQLLAEDLLMNSATALQPIAADFRRDIRNNSTQKITAFAWCLSAPFRATLSAGLIGIFVFLVCSYLTPVFTEHLIRQISAREIHVGTFCSLMVALACMYLSLNQVFWHAFLLGLHVRRSCFSLLEDLASDHPFYRDQVTSIASNDLTKLQMAFENVVLLLLVLPSIVITIGLIVSYLGVKSLIGIVILAIIVFSTHKVSGFIKRASAGIASGQKKRIYFVEIFLSRFEAICSQGLRERIKKLIGLGRAEELIALKRVNYWEVVLNAVFASMPLVIVMGSIFPLLIFGEKLELGPIFATMILLGTLQSSFTYLPRIVVALLQGVDSLQRFQAFVAQMTACAGQDEVASHSISSVIEQISGSKCLVDGDDRTKALDRLAHEFAKNQPVAYVRHEPWIIQGSLYDNLSCGGSINESHDNIDKVLNLVGLPISREQSIHDIEIKADASNISGGQAQRIALARILLIEADVIVLDDALRKLDADIRKKIFSALCDQGKTLIFSSTDTDERAQADWQLVNGVLHACLPQASVYRDLAPVDRNSQDVMAHVSNDAGTSFLHDKEALKEYASLLGTTRFWLVLILLLALHEGAKYGAEYLLSSPWNDYYSHLTGNIIFGIASIVAGTVAIYLVKGAALNGSENLWSNLVNGFCNARLADTQLIQKRSLYAITVHDQQIADQSAGNKAIALVIAVSSFVGTMVITAASAPLLLPLYLVLSIVYLKYAQSFRQIARNVAKINSMSAGLIFARLRELTDGIFLLRLARVNQQWLSKYLTTAYEQYARGLWVNRYLERWLCLRLELLGIMIFGGLVWLSQRGFAAFGLNPIMIGLALTYAAKLPATSGRVIRLLVDLDQDLVSTQNLMSFAMTGQTLQKKTDACQSSLSIPKQDLVIHVSKMSYCYPGASTNVLAEVDLDLRAGEHLAIVGHSGCGKSTFLKLLLGMYLPTQGSVRVLGHDSANLPASYFGQHIYYVPQFPVLLPSTLREVLHGDDDELWSALRVVGLTDKIRNSPHGLDSNLLNPDSFSWTNNEIQRLFLAGCLTTRATVVVLDEVFSTINNLDAKDMLQQIIDSLGGKRSLILISHQEVLTQIVTKSINLNDRHEYTHARYQEQVSV